jgi:hypothetical protein
VVPSGVVKIYHGRTLDQLTAMWRTTQEKADKEHMDRHTRPQR